MIANATAPGRHYQNAYVTRDLDAAVSRFETAVDLRRQFTTRAKLDVSTPDGPRDLEAKVAFLWVEDLNIELIEPIGGTLDLYSEAMPAGDGLGFHHVCHRVEDWAAARKAVDGSPFPLVLEGGHEALKFLFVDTREWLGHYLELCWMAPEAWKGMGGR